MTWALTVVGQSTAKAAIEAEQGGHRADPVCAPRPCDPVAPVAEEGAF